MKKIILGALLSIIVSPSAFAQAGPGPGPTPNPWIVNGSSIYYNKGAVGIGTSAPNANNAATLKAIGTGAPLNLVPASAPASPNNGDVWTTNIGVYARINGVTVGPFSASGNLTTETGIVAAGTTQGTATALNSGYNVHAVTTVSSGTGVELPATSANRFDIVINAGTNALKVYPVTGSQIDALGTNAALTIQPGSTVAFYDVTGTQIYSGAAPNIAAGTNVTLSQSGGVTTISVPAVGSTGNIQINSGSGQFGALGQGASVANPGTGSLEALLPTLSPNPDTGTNVPFGASTLEYCVHRSNSGTPMADTFPASSVTGLINGAKQCVKNDDTTAVDVLTAGSGTQFSGSSSTFVLQPNREIVFSYDTTGATPTWRVNGIGSNVAVPPTVALFPNGVINSTGASAKVDSTTALSAAFTAAGLGTGASASTAPQNSASVVCPDAYELWVSNQFLLPGGVGFGATPTASGNCQVNLISTNSTIQASGVFRLGGGTYRTYNQTVDHVVMNMAGLNGIAFDGVSCQDACGFNYDWAYQVMNGPGMKFDGTSSAGSVNTFPMTHNTVWGAAGRTAGGSAYDIETTTYPADISLNDALAYTGHSFAQFVLFNNNANADSRDWTLENNGSAGAEGDIGINVTGATGVFHVSGVTTNGIQTAIQLNPSGTMGAVVEGLYRDGGSTSILNTTGYCGGSQTVTTAQVAFYGCGLYGYMDFTNLYLGTGTGFMYRTAGLVSNAATTGSGTTMVLQTNPTITQPTISGDFTALYPAVVTSSSTGNAPLLQVAALSGTTGGADRAHFELVDNNAFASRNGWDFMNLGDSGNTLYIYSIASGSLTNIAQLTSGGNLNLLTGAYESNGTIGVTCSGSPTASFASKLGIVTHC
jgi:hypothetical protein